MGDIGEIWILFSGKREKWIVGVDVVTVGSLCSSFGVYRTVFFLFGRNAFIRRI